MADTVKYNGKDYGTDFVDFAGRYADDYASHKGMNQAQREAFMRELQNRLTEMRSGADGIDSNNNDIIYTGAISGKQKKNSRAWNGMDRDSFNTRLEVDNYLMGMSGRYSYLLNKLLAKKDKEEEEKAKSNTKVWTRHTGTNGDSTINDYLSKLWGNNLDMSDWANSTGDAFVNGVRDTAGRYKAINSALLSYLDDMLNGKYGELTDEMRDEISAVGEALNSPLDSNMALAYKKILGNNLYDRLFFTGEKYMTPEDVAAAEVKANKAKADDYVNLVEGALNPFAKGTLDWQTAETARQHNLDRRDYNNFGLNWTTDPGTWSFNDNVYAIDPSLFLNVSADEMKAALDALVNGALATVENEGDILGVGEFFHDRYKGYGKGDTSITDPRYRAILDAMGIELDDIDHGGTLGTGWNDRAWTNAGAMGRIALAYMRNRMNLNAKYRVNDGYILPEFINWDTGEAYLVNGSGSGPEGGVRRVNLRNYINLLTPEARREFFNLSRRHLGKLGLDFLGEFADLMENGGILKMLDGSYIPPSPKKLMEGYVKVADPTYGRDLEAAHQALVDRDIHTQEIGARNQKIEDHNNSIDFDASDWARLGTAVADLTGAVVSLSGFSPVGAAIGAGSTLTLFGLDIADGDVGMTDALKALGVGLALDAASLIPGNAASGIAKAAKTLSKFAVPIISAMQVMGNAEGAIATAKKVFSGDLHGITVGEWKEFTKALNGITNVTPMAKVAYSKRWGKLLAKTAGKDLTYQFDINGKKINLTRDEIRAINESEAPLEALKGKFSSGTLSAEDEAALQKLITTPGKWESKLGISPKLNEARGQLQNEYDFNKLRAIQQQRRAMINAGRDPNASTWTKLKGRMTEYGLDDANMAYSEIGNFTNLRRFFNKSSTPEKTGFDAFYNKQQAEFRVAESARKAIEAERRVASLQKAMEEGGMKVTDLAALDAANKEYLTALQEFMRVTGATDEAGALAELTRMENAYAGRGRFNYDATTGTYDRFGKLLEGIRKAVVDNKNAVSSSNTALRNARVKINKLLTEETDLTSRLGTLQRAERTTAKNLSKAEANLAQAKAELEAAKDGLVKLPSTATDVEKAARLAEVTAKLTIFDTAKAQVDTTKQAHDVAAKALTDTNSRLATISTEKTSEMEALLKNRDSLRKAKRAIAKYRNMFNKPNRADLLSELGFKDTSIDTRFNRFGSLSEKELLDIMALRKSKYDLLLKARELLQNYDKFLKAKLLVERKITNVADPTYAGAVAGGVRNPARFLQMLKDLVASNYNEDSVMKALANPELLAKMKALYKFKKGGQIPRYWNGSFFKKAGDGVKNAISLYSPTDALLVYGVLKANLVTDRNIEDLTKVRASELPALHYNNTIVTNNIQAPYESRKGQMYSSVNNIANLTSTIEGRMAALLAGLDKINELNNLEADTLSKQLATLQLLLANIDNTNIKAAYDRDVYNRKLRDSINARDVDLITQGRKAKEHQWLVLRNLYSTGRKHAEQQEYLMRMDDALNNDKGYKEAYRNYQLAKESYDMDPNEDTKKELKEAKVNLGTVTDTFKREYGRLTPPPSNIAFGNVRYRSLPSYRGNWFDNVGNEYSLASYESGGSIGKMTLAEMVKLFRNRETLKQKERDSYRKLLDKYAERTAKGSKSLAYQYYLKLINTIK